MKNSIYLQEFDEVNRFDIWNCICLEIIMLYLLVHTTIYINVVVEIIW